MSATTPRSGARSGSSWCRRTRSAPRARRSSRRSRAGCTTRVETPWRAADGSEIIVEWWPTSLDGYRKEHFLICAMDITARKRDEEELRRSRSRLVDAADAERRRLERNLHDGAQQRLVSLSLALRLAESKLRVDPEAASTILGGAGRSSRSRSRSSASLRAASIRRSSPTVASRRARDARRARERPGRARGRPRRAAAGARRGGDLLRRLRVAREHRQARGREPPSPCGSRSPATRSSSRSPTTGVGGADDTQGSGLRGLSRPRRGAERPAGRREPDGRRDARGRDDAARTGAATRTVGRWLAAFRRSVPACEAGSTPSRSCHAEGTRISGERRSRSHALLAQRLEPPQRLGLRLAQRRLVRARGRARGTRWTCSSTRMPTRHSATSVARSSATPSLRRLAAWA